MTFKIRFLGSWIKFDIDMINTVAELMPIINDYLILNVLWQYKI